MFLGLVLKFTGLTASIHLQVLHGGEGYCALATPPRCWELLRAQRHRAETEAPSAAPRAKPSPLGAPFGQWCTPYHPSLSEPKTQKLTWSPKEFIPQIELFPNSPSLTLALLHQTIPSLHSKIPLWLINTCRLPLSGLPGPPGRPGLPFTARRVLYEAAFPLPPWPGAQSRKPLPCLSASGLAEWWLQSAGTLPSGRKPAKRAALPHWGSWEQNQVRITQSYCGVPQQHFEIFKTSWFHFRQEAHSPPEAGSSPNPRQPVHAQRTLLIRVTGLGAAFPSQHARPSPSLAPSLPLSSPTPGEVGP